MLYIFPRAVQSQIQTTTGLLTRLSFDKTLLAVRACRNTYHLIKKKIGDKASVVAGSSIIVHNYGTLFQATFVTLLNKERQPIQDQSPVLCADILNNPRNNCYGKSSNYPQRIQLSPKHELGEFRCFSEVRLYYPSCPRLQAVAK